MAVFDRFAEWIRTLFGRGRRIPPPIPPPIMPRILKPRFFYNILWGHLIYRPIIRPDFKIPAGMTTLDEFISWNSQEGLTQEKSDHPLAIEIYAGLTLDHKITEKEALILKQILSDAILKYGIAGEILGFMEWGIESKEIDEERPLEAELRITRDGSFEDIKPIDITGYVKARIRELT